MELMVATLITATALCLAACLRNLAAAPLRQPVRVLRQDRRQPPRA